MYNKMRGFIKTSETQSESNNSGENQRARRNSGIPDLSVASSGETATGNEMTQNQQTDAFCNQISSNAANIRLAHEPIMSQRISNNQVGIGDAPFGANDLAIAFNMQHNNSRLGFYDVATSAAQRYQNLPTSSRQSRDVERYMENARIVARNQESVLSRNSDATAFNVDRFIHNQQYNLASASYDNAANSRGNLENAFGIGRDFRRTNNESFNTANVDMRTVFANTTNNNDQHNRGASVPNDQYNRRLLVPNDQHNRGSLIPYQSDFSSIANAFGNSREFPNVDPNQLQYFMSQPELPYMPQTGNLHHEPRLRNNAPSINPVSAAHINYNYLNLPAPYQMNASGMYGNNGEETATNYSTLNTQGHANNEIANTSNYSPIIPPTPLYVPPQPLPTLPTPPPPSPPVNIVNCLNKYDWPPEPTGPYISDAHALTSNFSGWAPAAVSDPPPQNISHAEFERILIRAKIHLPGNEFDIDDFQSLRATGVRARRARRQVNDLYRLFLDEGYVYSTDEQVIEFCLSNIYRFACLHDTDINNGQSSSFKEYDDDHARCMENSTCVESNDTALVEESSELGAACLDIIADETERNLNEESSELPEWYLESYNNRI